jgi:hypothetical protein
MSSDHPRQRAEKDFKQVMRARNARKAMAEYETQALAVREKMARLKALRLAKEAQAQSEPLNRAAKRNDKWRTETRRDK